MKCIAVSFVFFMLTLNACVTKTDIQLLKEEISISADNLQFELNGNTKGIINFEFFVENGFKGECVLQQNDASVVSYQINTNKQLYPLRSPCNEWNKLSLNWNFENASLAVFLNGQLQTTQLFTSENITSVNHLIIKPLSNSKKLKVKNVSAGTDSLEVSKRLKIISFGNSTTAQQNAITGVYSQRLPQLLLNNGIPNIVINEGVKGSHTGHLTDNSQHQVPHALDRFQTSVLEKSPDIVILCFGLNDSWHDEDDNLPRIKLEDYEANLRYIITALIDRETKVILLTPNAIGKQFEKWRYDYTLKYVQTVRKLAHEYELPLIDQWKAFEDYAHKGNDTDELLLDGLHPNDIWHEKLAEMLTSEITKLYER